MSSKSKQNLYTLLQEIKKRPSMFVKNYSLDQVSDICFGYQTALKDNDVNEFGVDFTRKFSDFLSEKHGYGTSYGWAHALKTTAYSSEKSFKTFFKLLAEYKKEYDSKK